MSALAACLCLLPVARGQEFTPFLEQGEYSPAGTTSAYTMPFDYDLQAFSPFEVDDFGTVAPRRTGWFFTYNRLYWNVTPPEASQKADGDFGWGNRLDIGYMTPENAGWMFEGLQMSGPNLPNNSSEMSGFEFDRIFRTTPLENGSYFTPSIGLRYVNIIDRTIPFSDTGSAGTGPPNKNNIVGGQVGLGWQFRKGQWQIATNSKLFVAENFQVFETRFVNANNMLVGGPGTSRKEFVPAGELRFDASYYLTRDIALNFGWELLYFGRGITRAQQLQANDESMMYTGALFGVVWNGLP